MSNIINLDDLPPVPGLDGAEKANYLFELITQEAAAKFVGLGERTLEKKRSVGGGPDYIEVSPRAIRYRRIDLWAWAEARKRRHTADDGGPHKSAA